MEITGINRGTGSIDYSAGRNTAKVENNAFDENVKDVTQRNKVSEPHRKQDYANEKQVVGYWVDIQSGTSFEVYRPKDFDPANPVYTVTAHDADGSVAERMVDVSKINPRNCDSVEMYTYSFYLKENGAGFEDTVLKAAVANAVNRANTRQGQTFSAGEYLTKKMDWVDVVKDIMQSQQKMGDWKGYLDFRNFLSYLER